MIVMTFLFYSCGHHQIKNIEEEEMFINIDEEIKNIPIYDSKKEKRINDFQKRLLKEAAPEVKHEIIDLLISEYESYNSDSALYYININLENPQVKANKQEELSLLIKKADIAAHAGLFGESYDILTTIERGSLDSTLLESYYSAFCDLYQYQSEYATDSEFAKEYEKERELYIDSIRSIAPDNSFNYVVYHAASAARKGDFKEAEDLLFNKLNSYSSGDRNYSILSSILADIYFQKGDKNNYKKYLGESVISDIRGAVKENMAIRALATQCYEEGDVERANRYLRQSFEDANFYSARMRNSQSSRMLPIIGNAYTEQQKTHTHELRLFVIFISILAFGFIIISIFAFLQVKKVRQVNKKTQEMLDKVTSMTSKLSVLNNELNNANKELKTSIALKEQYAVLFLEYCSLAISSLQKYQQSLKVVANQGNLTNLIKKIDSANIENKTLAEFYSKFDEAILNIYPNFVEKFNSLLLPDERIELKIKNELTTELRVFALIRIGINDSEKISKFLRCSITTVYTYRSKMKKKALNPETFEADILNI